MCAYRNRHLAASALARSRPHKFNSAQKRKKMKKALGCIQLASTVATAVFAAEMP
jgi:hypothetical protein